MDRIFRQNISLMETCLTLVSSSTDGKKSKLILQNVEGRKVGPKDAVV